MTQHDRRRVLLGSMMSPRSPSADLLAHLHSCPTCQRGDHTDCRTYATLLQSAVQAPRLPPVPRHGQARGALTPLGWCVLLGMLLGLALIAGVLYSSCQQVLSYYHRPLP